MKDLAYEVFVPGSNWSQDPFGSRQNDVSGHSKTLTLSVALRKERLTMRENDKVRGMSRVNCDIEATMLFMLQC